MYFSTYRWGIVALFAAIGIFLCVLFSFFSLVLAIGFGVLYAIVVYVDLWFRFTLKEGAMAETGGVSTRDFFDLVDDRDPKVVDAYNRGIRPRIPDEEELDEAPAAENCPSCGAMLLRPDAKYCDECGKPIRSLPPLPPDSPGNHRPSDP
jgi:hypothetical protein